MIYTYKNKRYPGYLKQGNACQYITPIAKKFCQGIGVDVGANKWPFPGAMPIDEMTGGSAYEVPEGLDYVFSSHCLEHLEDPIKALENWKKALKPKGVLFLYLPHPEMEYWLPQNCRKHLHSWTPEEMAKILEDLGFKDILYSQRDLAWSFSVVGTR